MTKESQTGNSYLSKSSISRTNPLKSVKDGTSLGIFKERKYWPLSLKTRKKFDEGVSRII